MFIKFNNKEFIIFLEVVFDFNNYFYFFDKIREEVFKFI